MKAGHDVQRLEPHPRQGRAARRRRARRSSTARPTSPTSTFSSPWYRPRRTSRTSSSARTACSTARPAPAPRIFVDCSSIGGERVGDDPRATEGSRRGVPRRAGQRQRQMRQGRQAQHGRVRPASMPSRWRSPISRPSPAAGVAYVGEGELARFCKIAHNVFLGVVIQNLSEITVLAEKAGVPRHAFLAFINNSVLGSIFSRYKTPALVNLDFTTTFTPALLQEGPRSRPCRRPRAGRRHARDRRDARGAAGPFRRGFAPRRSRGVSRAGLRRRHRDRGACRRNEARKREPTRCRAGSKSRNREGRRNRAAKARKGGKNHETSCRIVRPRARGARRVVGQSPPRPVVFGASLPLTGGLAINGQKHKEGYELCIDLINKDGGLLGEPASIIISDNQSTNETAPGADSSA